MTRAQYRLGVDIGGTFTDIVMVDSSGAVYSRKLLSTPADYSEAIENGVSDLLAELDLHAGQISEFVHATTVATNALIERKGARVGLVTTQGFRDVLELSRFRAPRPYDMRFRKPEPLVTRELRFEAVERIGAAGDVVVPLDEGRIHDIAHALKKERVDAVAVCFLNSHANEAHEKRAAELLQSFLPGVAVTASISLLPQIGEYERTSTTVVNAYIRPVVESYVQALEQRFAALEIEAPLMIMQSSGGISPASVVAEKPIYIIESGPAAGVLGAQRLGAQIGVGDMIVFDMGGTTAKATIIEQSCFGVCPETEVGGGAPLGQRMIKGSGYPVQVPTIDIAEVGAGGGSIAAVDAAGGLQVGPRSAGASPGPVCYDRGGEQPTVTDANLLLGYLDPGALVGGELRLSFDKARAALVALGQDAKLAATETAYGVHLIANATMLRALRGVSSERGHDPSQFALLAIGGNGPVHAGTLAEAAGMRHIIVPPVAGLFSALGMLFADVEHQLATGFYRKFAQVTPEDISATAAELVRSGRELLAREGYRREAQQHIVLGAELKYVGQTSPLTVAFSEMPITREVIDGLARAFEQEHLKTFGYASSDEPLQFVALKAICRGVPDTPRMVSSMRRHNERSGSRAERRAYFGEEHGWHVTPVIARADLDAQPTAGPLVIQEYDTTIIVRPGWTARLDAWNNVHMERAPLAAPIGVGGGLARPLDIDPVKRELLKNALVTITDNVLVMIVRTARSANVKNSMDFSAAILDADGELVAQGLAVPVHLGAMMPAMKGCVEHFGVDIQEGDILASNDPYSGCSHLNDIFLFKPVFASKRRVAWIGIVLHHTDLGGRVPGGNAADSNEIFEEGLRIPPSKLVEAGRVNQTLMRLVEFNSRVPQRVVADLRAQIAAIDQAERELRKLASQWRSDELCAYMRDLVDYSERLTRAQIAALPDGETEFTEWNDDDGIGGGPVRIHARLIKKADTLTIDFSETDRRVGGAVHSIYAFTASCTYAAVRTVLDIDIPSNAGFYRPIEIIAPVGTFVNAPFPAAVGSRGQSGFRIRSVVLGALALLMPDRLTACPGGSEFAISVSGYAERSQRFLHLEFHNNTGHGGGPDRDGQDAGPYCIGNLANVPVELIEAENPIRIEEYAFLPDTGGPGRYRGGLGIVRQYRILAEEALVQVRSDRHLHRAWGLFGGEPGAGARNVLNPRTRNEAELASKFVTRLKRNDVLRAEMAAAGGYGDPFERAPHAVAIDVLQEKISREAARRQYGVVVSEEPGQLDSDATHALRRSLRS